MEFNILTIFPKILNSYFTESILGKAQDKGLIKIKTTDIRKFSKDKHRSVDDTPFGGGPGMIMQVQPIYDALRSVRRKKKSRVVLLDPRGRQFNTRLAKTWAKLDQLIFIAGRYQDIDARVKKLVDDKISVGPYILSGGELPAAIIIEAVSRYVPGVLGNKESWQIEDKAFDQYTRPREFKTRDGKIWPVPEVLLSGDHQAIEKWRKLK